MRRSQIPPLPRGGVDVSWPPEERRRSALVRKLGWVDFGGTGVYGAFPSTFCPCGSTAFLGAEGPGGRISSSSCVVDSGTVGRRAFCSALGAAGDWFELAGEEEDENFEDMLESQELRRTPVGLWILDFVGKLPEELTGVFRVYELPRWGICRGVEG